MPHQTLIKQNQSTTKQIMEDIGRNKIRETQNL